MKETGKINYVEMPSLKLSGGAIAQDIFTFPGGRRFHFNDPNGNEYAVWSEPDA